MAASTSMRSLKLILLVMSTSLFSLALSQMPTSTISAAPTLLPTISPSPAVLSPDMNPVFPSPGGDGLSPTESSLPIIPSSPSPPNPDDMAPSGPTDMATSPSGSLSVSASSSLNAGFEVAIAFWCVIVQIFF